MRSILYEEELCYPLLGRTPLQSLSKRVTSRGFCGGHLGNVEEELEQSRVDGETQAGRQVGGTREGTVRRVLEVEAEGSCSEWSCEPSHPKAVRGRSVP